MWVLDLNWRGPLGFLNQNIRQDIPKSYFYPGKNAGSKINRSGFY